MSDFLQSLIGPVISGVTGLFGQGMSNWSNEKVNDQQIASAERLNEQNLAFSREALEAQKAQQKWSNEQYVESRDYNRALQQTIFNREDTAVQRALQDVTSAGFSPLAALGLSAGAGSVVSSPTAPSSMVSNNQASMSTPNLRANDYGNLAQAGSQIAQLLATSFESRKAQDNQVFITNLQLAEQAKEAGLSRLHEKMMSTLEHDFLKNQSNVEHMRQLMYRLSDQSFQKELQAIAHQNNLELAREGSKSQADLQSSQQSWQSAEAEKSRAADKNRGTYLNQIINALSVGDSKMSKWLRNNSDLLIPVLQYIDSIVAQ